MSQPAPSVEPSPTRMSQTGIDLIRKFDDDLTHLIGRTFEIMAASGISPREGVSGICGCLLNHYVDLFAKSTGESTVQAFCTLSGEIKTALEAIENGANGK